MARILLTTLGSLGDLHPVLALALELRRRGHRAEVATSAFRRQGRRRSACPSIRCDRISRSPDEALVRRMMDGARGSERLLRDFLFPAAREIHTDLAPAAAGADLLVSSEIIYAAPIIAAKTGLPWVSFALAPISLFSIHDPSRLPVPPGCGWIQDLGPGANRLLKAIALRVTWPWWEPVRALRRELGLPPGENPLFEGKLSPQLDLAMFSPELQRPQPDWPRQTRQTGFPFFSTKQKAPGPACRRRSRHFSPPGNRRSYSRWAPPPFSSPGIFTPKARAPRNRSGNAPCCCSATTLPPANLPPTAMAWKYLPYARVFPGRPSSSTRAGSARCQAHARRAADARDAFAHDQPDNADRVTRLGVGRTIARGSYTAGSGRETGRRCWTIPRSRAGQRPSGNGFAPSAASRRRATRWKTGCGRRTPNGRSRQRRRRLLAATATSAIPREDHQHRQVRPTRGAAALPPR